MWYSIPRLGKRTPWLAVACLGGALLAAAPAPVTPAERQRVYDEVKTPYKHGIVIRGGAGEMVDCPSVFRFGGKWLMLYVAIKDKVDLVHWTKWEGPHLIEPSEPWDKTFAHKQWLLKQAGVVYHFYCAVGDQGRAIALATSKELLAVPAPTFQP